VDLVAIRQAAEAIAIRAGETILDHLNQPHQEMTKTSVFDVVTEGDTAAEQVIVAGLRELTPDVAIVTEESGLLSASAQGQGEVHGLQWHIDPIDGTTNFAIGLPFFCVSLALADHTLQPLIGVVYDPVARELFSAARGLGAALNGSPIHVTTTETLERAVVSTGFSYNRHLTPDNNLAQWGAMLMRVRGLRRLGSAALELAYVAAGRLDAFWEKYIQSWDCLAGLLLVAEAGGRISDYSGGSERLYSGEQVVASNGRLHDALLEVLNA
jgi:myo-inositol-1(or 4)-monophosphatase